MLVAHTTLLEISCRCAAYLMIWHNLFSFYCYTFRLHVLLGGDDRLTIPDTSLPYTSQHVATWLAEEKKGLIGKNRNSGLLNKAYTEAENWVN